jgi:lipopolysaccharide export system permease protein
LRPVLVFSLPIIALIAYLSIVVTPWASAKGVQFVEQMQGRDELAAISPGVFKESSQADRVFFVESFDELGNKVKNIFVQSFQHQKLGIMVAQTGYRKVEENGDTFLVMENGKRYEGKPDTPEFSVTKFERYAIREKPAEIKHEAPGIKSTSSQELMKSDYRGSKAELHWRLAVPISALILVLLAIPLSFVDPRAGRSANLMMALLIYIIYSNLLSVMRIKIVQGKISTLVGMWPVHAIFLALAFYLVYRRLFLLPILPRIGVINRILKRP